MRFTTLCGGLCQTALWRSSQSFILNGVSIQISINFGKKFLRISSIRKFAVTWIFARVFAQLTVLIISLIYSEWRDSENQQLRHPVSIFDWRKTNSVRFIPEIAPRRRWRCSRLRFRLQQLSRYLARFAHAAQVYEEVQADLDMMASLLTDGYAEVHYIY